MVFNVKTDAVDFIEAGDGVADVADCGGLVSAAIQISIIFVKESSRILN